MRRAAKQNCSTRPSMSTAVTPPATAPTAVATSNSIPRRMLVIPRVTKAVCAIDDVAITQTMLVAMATLMGTPKARLSMGTMMMPPPTPSMLPKTPATKATARSAMRTLVAGVFGSMLGVGGGIIMVPMLSLAFGVPIKVAIATSIVCVIATSSMAQTAFVSRGMTNVRLGMLFEVATAVGAVAGGVTAVLIDGRVLQFCFAALRVYVAWQMNRRGGDVTPARTGVL